MRIAIDARLNAYRQGGIPQYTRQVLTALADIARDDQFVSLQHREQLRPLVVAPNVSRRTLLTPPHHRYEQWTLPLELLLARPDVLHCPDFIAPERRPCPAVVTIHDLAFMHYPEILDDAAREYYGRIKTNAARADGIIAVSEATRQDIAQFLDIPIEEIAVIHEAAAPLYGRIELRDGEARVLNATPVASKSFMLFVSTLEPRKNLPTLLHALRICLDRRPDRPYLLVVAGARGWRDEQIFQTVRDLRLADHVLFAGSVGQYDLRWLYNACRFYINPSLYEGFGLPLLEAMACGAPCLAAATSSLPEIGGDAAIYVPPLDAGNWADAIIDLWDDEDRQLELGRLGRVQAQRFSWVRAARETRKIYERAITRARGGAVDPLPLPPQERRLREEEPPSIAPRLAPGAAEASPVWAGGARPCLRCGTPMLAGRLQQVIALQTPEGAPDPTPLASQAWACPRCGHVELVVEQKLDPAESEAQEAGALAVAPAAEADVTPQAEAEGEAAAPSIPVIAPAADAETEADVMPQTEAEGAEDARGISVIALEDADVTPQVEAELEVAAPHTSVVAPEAEADVMPAVETETEAAHDLMLSANGAVMAERLRDIEALAEPEQPDHSEAEIALNGVAGTPAKSPGAARRPRAGSEPPPPAQPAQTTRRQSRTKRKRS